MDSTIIVYIIIFYIYSYSVCVLRSSRSTIYFFVLFTAFLFYDLFVLCSNYLIFY